LQAVYDYGQWGSELKKNIKDYWWKAYPVAGYIVGIDASIFTYPLPGKLWSVGYFNDPMIDNKDSKKRLPGRSFDRSTCRTNDPGHRVDEACH